MTPFVGRICRGRSQSCCYVNSSLTMLAGGDKFESGDGASEDVATMVRILRSQLKYVMDITHHIEASGVLENFYAIPHLTTTDATQLYTYCNELSLRVNEKVWKKYEDAGLIRKLEKFFQQVANYRDSCVDAKLLETPTERLLGAAHAQGVLRTMLSMVNQQNADIENLLKERYSDLQQLESGYSANEARQLLTKLITENNRLDEQLQQLAETDVQRLDVSNMQI